MKFVFSLAPLFILHCTTAMANTTDPILKIVFATGRFNARDPGSNQYKAYLLQSIKKKRKNTDSSHIFYKVPIPNYTDYLPLSGGTVTGTTYLSAGSEGSISFYPFTSSTKYWQMNAGDAASTVWAFGYQNPSGAISSDYVITSYTDSDGWKERLRIQHATGSIGIGTNSPYAGSKLHVAGGMLVSDAFSGTTGSTGGIDYSVGGLRFFSMGATGSTKGTFQWIAKGSDGSSSSPMIIDATGNLGIGVSSTTYKLDVNGTLHTAGQSELGGGVLHVSTDQSFSSDAQYTFRDAVGINNPNGSSFATATSVMSLGNMSNGTSLVTSGAVGVGLTSPSSGSKLHVNGGILVSDAFSGTTGSSGGIDYSGGLRMLSMGTSGSTKGTFTWIAKGADGSSFTPMSIDASGNIGIGVSPTADKLSVNGNITAKKMMVTQLGWSDYVFDKAYELRSLSSLESFIIQNKHLPEMPSAKEVEEKGISVGDNQALLLKKIEELTLYIIQQQKEINELKRQNKGHRTQINTPIKIRQK